MVGEKNINSIRNAKNQEKTKKYLNVDLIKKE